jgi:hypothetical protein
MVIKHRPDKNHGNTDGLSRIVEDEAVCPNYLSGVELKNLPEVANIVKRLMKGGQNLY